MCSIVAKKRYDLLEFSDFIFISAQSKRGHFRCYKTLFYKVQDKWNIKNKLYKFNCPMHMVVFRHLWLHFQQPKFLLQIYVELTGNQWRQSGVSKGQNPPFFLLHFLVASKSSRNDSRAQWINQSCEGMWWPSWVSAGERGKTSGSPPIQGCQD